MKQRWTYLHWLLLSLPLMTSLGALVVLRLEAVEDGRTFAQGMHFFKYGPLFVLAWLVFLFSLIPACVVVVRRKEKIAAAFACAFVSLFIMLAIPTVVWDAFFAARDRAYTELDLLSIYKACRDVHPTLWKGQPREIQEFDVELASLPEPIRRVRPFFVQVAANSVVLQMDGGGPMYHEGIGVALNGREPKSTRGLRRLGPDVPVYLYRLYDHRQFEDALVGEQKGETCQ